MKTHRYQNKSLAHVQHSKEFINIKKMDFTYHH